jgi:hypothetical protein
MKRKLLILGVLLGMPAWAFGATIFQSDMDTSAGWTVVGTADTQATWGWDFTTMGIPASPGGSTTGLKLEANISSGTGNTVVAYPTGLFMSGQFIVEFDFWANANGPFPGGGSGSTEFIGGGVGYDGAVPVPTSSSPGLAGGYHATTGEGGSSRDYRMFKNSGEQYVASGQYDIDTNNAFDPNLGGSIDLYTKFPPPITAPAFQQANYAQQTGSLRGGSAGFAWHHMTITADTIAGTVNFDIDGLSIGTIDANIGSTFPSEGFVQVHYSDIFSSLSDNPALSFGVIDNFVVTPEPASLLLGLLGVALLRRR